MSSVHHVVVAKDGSGDFTSIKQAIGRANGQSRLDIYVKEGEYHKYLEIQKEFITLHGDGIGKTIITGNRSHAGGYPPFKSATVDPERSHVVVAKDGSGDFTSIKQAIGRANGQSRFEIYVKEGEYHEYLEIQKEFITLHGDGIGKTIITGNRSHAGGYPPFKSATVAVLGNGFIAQHITFRNTAGPTSGQAVALKSQSDESAFYKCSFEGYQDTLYVKSYRQFYRECDVYGTVDFIFGDASAIFQKCNIYVHRHTINTITASEREQMHNTGIVIHDSCVTAAPDLQPVLGSTKTYLGRPWKKYARTVFMKTCLYSLIDPSGWYKWDRSNHHLTCFYGEFQNSGPGASTSRRVTWPGFKILSTTEALEFTVGNFIEGDTWIPSSIPFTNGL